MGLPSLIVEATNLTRAAQRFTHEPHGLNVEARSLTHEAKSLIDQAPNLTHEAPQPHRSGKKPYP
jgi:hypothetical protein